MKYVILVNVKRNLLLASSQRDRYQDGIRNARDLLEGMLVNRKGKKQNKKKEHDCRLGTYARKNGRKQD